MQLHEIRHAFPDRIVGDAGRHGGLPIAAHVGCDAAPAQHGEVTELVFPDHAEFRPAMDENHQRAVDRACLDPGGVMPRRCGAAFTKRCCHHINARASR